jgi:hypothetical protein
MKDSKVKVVVVMEGGIIHDIITNSDNLEVTYIDYDVEELDCNQKLIPQENGVQHPSYCYTFPTTLDETRTERLSRIAKEKSQFEEIRFDYKDENGVIHLDGFENSDPDAEGVGIGYIFNKEFYPRDPKFLLDPYVQVVVDYIGKLA